MVWVWGGISKDLKLAKLGSEGLLLGLKGLIKDCMGYVRVYDG